MLLRGKFTKSNVSFIMCSGWRWDTHKFTLLSYFVVMFAGSFELSVHYFNVLLAGSFELIVDYFNVLYFCLFR